MKEISDLIPPHGGYSNLVTYKLGNLIYDATAAFCDRYINRRERTYDQMVQAARSGVANIVEGSEAGAALKTLRSCGSSWHFWFRTFRTFRTILTNRTLKPKLPETS